MTAARATGWGLLVLRIVALAIVAGFAVAAVDATRDGTISVTAYVVAIGGVVLLEALRWLGRVVPTDHHEAPALVAWRPTRDDRQRPLGLVEWEALTAASAVSARPLWIRLAPRYRYIAESRLSTSRGLAIDHPAAEALLGPAGWALAHHPRGAAAADAPGLDCFELEAAVAALEAL